MTRTSIITLCAPLVAVLIGAPTRAAAQLPFELTGDDLATVDTSAIVWTRLTTHIGGLEGNVRYQKQEPALEECKAVALLTGVRMQRQYVRKHEEEPVSLRLDLVCGDDVSGLLRYDGLMLSLVIREEITGAVLYDGRRRGFP